jgi:hypothetical protein
MKQIFIGTIIAFILIIGTTWAVSQNQEVDNIQRVITVEETPIEPVEKVNYNKQFIDRMAMLEGSGNPKAISKSGSYIGKYQFGRLAFKEVGYKINIGAFKRNPNILPEKTQEKLFLKLCLANKRYLEKEIERYSGRTIKGIKITKAGMLAAAHLRGYSAVKTFLKTKGRVNLADGNGKKVSEYLAEFQHISDHELNINEALNEYESKNV